MKYLFQILLLLIPGCILANGFLPGVKQAGGQLSFKCNGIQYKADSTHARAYTTIYTSETFINGARKDKFVLGIEWKDAKKPGVFLLTEKVGKVSLSLDHIEYSILNNQCHLKITVTSVRTAGSFLLLTGKFEGRLQNKKGETINITDGMFQTVTL